MSKKLTAIGLMSGTSLDGIDVALIYSDGKTIENPNYFLSKSYSDSLRAKIRKLIESKDRYFAKEVEREVTIAHAHAVNEFLERYNLQASDIDLIGFHGQTIDHKPDESMTWQIGDGKLLAELAEINVVNDFRSNDVREGGQGAPLVPVYHVAIMKNLPKPVAILNIGGVANVTYIDGDDLIAFDTGTGNAMLDDLVLAANGESCDFDGKFSEKGVVDKAILAELMNNEYFAKMPPKSIDRNDFVDSASVLQDIYFENAAATLIAFMAEAVARAQEFFPQKPKAWYVSGGGRHNPTMMKELSTRLGKKIHKIEELGENGDAIEAEAFAFLAIRSFYKMPITFSSTTGIKKSSATGGVFCPV